MTNSTAAAATATTDDSEMKALVLAVLAQGKATDKALAEMKATVAKLKNRA